MSRSVFIAGRGAVSGYGAGLDILVEGIFSGLRAVRPRARTLAFQALTDVAAELPAGCLGEEVAEIELPLRMAVHAGQAALDEAGASDRSNLDLILATTKAELSGLGSADNEAQPPTRPPTHPTAGLGFPARLAQRIATQLRLRGVASSVSTACASGVTALAMAERRIASGEAERILVVGTDALNRFIMTGFGGMGILDPEPCRPFDLSRRGISLGEGAGAMLLSADARESIGVRIAGHGGANDACHVTGCDREGGGVERAVRRALEHARVAPADIDLIHLHGTGTKANDFSEATGIGKAFGGTSALAFGTKSQTGHTLGAAGLIESLIAIAALERSCVPANAGLIEPNVDPLLQLARDNEALTRSRRALKIAGGFGGIQQAMVFEA